MKKRKKKKESKREPTKGRKNGRQRKSVARLSAVFSPRLTRQRGAEPSLINLLINSQPRSVASAPITFNCVPRSRATESGVNDDNYVGSILSICASLRNSTSFPFSVNYFQPDPRTQPRRKLPG